VRTTVIAGTAALAAFGVLGMAPAAVQASADTSAPAWTKQAPAAHPVARGYAAMAYDAATGNTVLFGGIPATGRDFGDTWTWDGSTWTKQAPATSPPARTGATMAYDAATGTVVMFGGDPKKTSVNHVLADTWTWDGSTWTKQAPKTSPPGRDEASMAYDAASGTVVLFGGSHPDGLLGDTWTWHGHTWTEQALVTNPHARAGASMAYDAASGTVVMFGGFDLKNPEQGRALSDTWTWG
jgi:hypothetical protein